MNSSHSIVPAINCHDKDFECVKEKIRIAETLGTEWIHVDVADGVFTYNRTWNEPEKWPELKGESSLSLEVHLMVEAPLAEASAWLEVGARRLIVHVEVVHEEVITELVELARKFGATVMVSMNPETSIDRVKPCCSVINEFQILGVHPGLARQKFLPSVLEKIKELRKELPDAFIEVDGGVNEEVAKQAIEAGANALVSASYIFESKDPKGAYETLKNL